MNNQVKKISLVKTTYNSSTDPEIKTKYHYSFEYNNAIYINLSEIGENKNESN